MDRASASLEIWVSSAGSSFDGPQRGLITNGLKVKYIFLKQKRLVESKNYFVEGRGILKLFEALCGGVENLIPRADISRHGSVNRGEVRVLGQE